MAGKSQYVYWHCLIRSYELYLSKRESDIYGTASVTTTASPLAPQSILSLACPTKACKRSVSPKQVRVTSGPLPLSNRKTEVSLIKPLTPNVLYTCRAVRLLNSRMATVVATNSVCVSIFGGIFFTRIRLLAVVFYAVGPVKVRLSYGTQIVPPPTPKPLHIRQYIRLHFVKAHFSTMTSTCFD